MPVAFFEPIGKTERNSGQAKTQPIATKSPDHDSGYSDSTGPVSVQNAGPQERTSKTMGKGAGAMVYGVVMYDFAAERPDELEAKQGEAIIVIAQSNPEWFVAKPIGRLGGPGLIPVSFIEIRDMSTGKAVPDAQEAVQRAGVPKVEEWKKMAADYKNSSITLGKFETSAAQQQALEQSMDRMSLQQGMRQSQNNGQNYVSIRPFSSKVMHGCNFPNFVQQTAMQAQQGKVVQSGQLMPQNTSFQHPISQLYAPISAHIPRYCFAEDKYWFVIEAALEDGRHWELSRYYEDFYDFQIALLTEFPAEAGNTGTQTRTLPYMPGPVNYVTDAITDGRRHNLDAYVKNLLTQPPYISKCSLVKQFFSPREGDFEIDPSAEYEGSQQSSEGTPPDGASRQSSRGNLNGNGYGGLSAAPVRQGNTNGGQAQYPAGPTRQTSSLSQPSTNSLQNGANAQAALSAMKVKIYFGDDLFAIRVPRDIQYQQLYEKIRDRLKISPEEEIAMYYKDESSGERPSLMSNNDLDFALQRNDKLIIIVEYN